MVKINGNIEIGESKKTFNDLINAGEYEAHSLTFPSSLFQPSGWRKMYNDLNVSLKKGVYLFIMNYSYSGNGGPGIATARPVVNDVVVGNMVRQSTPIGLNLVISAQTTSIFEAPNDGIYTFNGELYSSLSFTTQSGIVQLIRIK